MPLPVTISGVNTRGAGPSKSSAGNFYAPWINSGATGIAIIKATDPSSSWSVVTNSSTLSSGGLLQYVNVDQVGDVLHIVASELNANTLKLFYLRYDMSSESFTLTETLSTTYANAGDSFVDIEVRSTGEVILSHSIAGAAVMGSTYTRTGFSRRATNGTWTQGTAVDATGGTINYYPGACVLGDSDRIHFFYQGANNSHRTLTSANALQTIQTLGPMYDAISFSDGTNRRLVASDGINIQRATSADVPTWTAASTALGASASIPQHLFVDGTDVYAIYAKTDGDLYVRKSTDFGATWSSETSIFVAAISNSQVTMFGQPKGVVYQRGSDVVLGYFANDGGTIKYNEYVARTIVLSPRNASANQDLLPVTQTTTGQGGVLPERTGEATQTLGTLTQTATATARVTGSATQSLPVVTQTTGVNTAIGVAANQTLAPVTQTTSGALASAAQATQSLAPLTQAVTGGPRVSGAATQALPAHTSTANVGAAIAGSASQALGALTQSATGTTRVAGAASQTLIAPTQTGTGDVDASAQASQSLAPVTQTTAGGAESVQANATANQTLATLTQTATGGVRVTGTSAQTLASPTQTAAGTTPHAASASQALSAHMQTAAGDVDVSGSPTQTLAAVTQAASGDADISGSALQALPLLTQTFQGDTGAVVERNGAANQSLAALTQTATGEARVSGAAAQSLAPLTQTATGTTRPSAQASQTLGAVTQVTTGSPRVAGAASQSLPSLSQTMNGSVRTSSASSQTLAAITQTIAASPIIASDADQTLAPTTQAASGTLPVVASSEQTLSAVTQDATATLTVRATAEQTLEPHTQFVLQSNDPVNASAAQDLLPLAATSSGDTDPLSALWFEGEVEPELVLQAALSRAAKFDAEIKRTLNFNGRAG